MLAENEELGTETAPEKVNERPTELDEELETETASEKVNERPTKLSEPTPNLSEPEVADEPEKPTPKPKPVRRKSAPSLKQVVNWFAACARCSFFLAGYKTAVGADALDEAAGDSHAGWLTLAWNQAVCSLVHKSYGSRLDMDCYHYDGICPDCRRHFSFRGAVEEDERNSFQIELKPRAGRRIDFGF